jgi:flagellar hook-length control protein FliK
MKTDASSQDAGDGSEKNFLSDLLNILKDETKLLDDIIKNLNLKETDLKNIENPKNKILSGFSKESESNTDKISSLKDNLINQQNNKTSKIEVNDILKKLLNITDNKIVSNQTFENKINDYFNKNKITEKKYAILPIPIPNKNNLIVVIPKEEKDFVQFTKKLIESQNSLEQMKLTPSEKADFANINSFKDLVDFADKKNLNLSKIIISYGKKINYTKTSAEKTSENALNLPGKKIETDALIKNSVKAADTAEKDISQQTNAKTPGVPKNQSILTTLLSDNAKKTEKTKKQDILTDLKNIKTEIKNKTNPANQPLHTEKNAKPDDKNPNSGQDSNPKNLTSAQINSTLKQQAITAKQSIQHFASDLKDAIENYKPPVSKLSLELNPKELGKVEVTLIHRGDNLQIQINSNNTAVNFLHSQQQELRQNLINMGFTDVNMSFNQQQEQGNRQYRQNQKMNGNNEDGDELVIEIPYQYA